MPASPDFCPGTRPVRLPGLIAGDQTSQESFMRPILCGVLAALLLAGNPAQSGFFLDRSKSGLELATGEHGVMLPRARAGIATSQYFVGLYRYFGVGVEQDRAEGLMWLRRAAEGGIEGAQRALTFILGAGIGTAPDPVEAAKWQALAEEGWKGGGADRRLGFNFGEGNITISGPAIDAYTRAAEQGDLGAILRLSYFYGTRVRRSDLVADGVEAAKWTKLAAESEHPSALNNLGVLIANGWNMPRDDLKATELFKRAAEAGVLDAQVSYAIMAAEGRGMAKNPAESAKWYEVAAERGAPLAQIALAWAYSGGLGIPRDDAKALQWLIRASGKGCVIEASLLGFGVGMAIESRMPVEYQNAEAKHGPC
jgi:uncharacterized protein